MNFSFRTIKLYSMLYARMFAFSYKMLCLCVWKYACQVCVNAFMRVYLCACVYVNVQTEHACYLCASITNLIMIILFKEIAINGIMKFSLQ